MAVDHERAFQAAVEAGRARGRKIALVLFGFVGVACLASFCGGAYAIWQGMFGEATIYLYHRTTEPVEVWLDGDLSMELTAPGATEVRLDKGDHTMELRGTTTQTFDLPGMNGLGDWLIPTDPGTCFVLVDVTHALVGSEEPDPCRADLSSARLTCTYERFPHGVGRPRFTLEDLPDSASDARLVFMTLPVACDPMGGITGESVLRDYLGCSREQVSTPALSPE